MAAPPKKFNKKQERFAREYLVDLNATQAAIRAGYSAKTADISCMRLLAHPGVKEFIAKNTERKSKSLDLTAERVLEELMLLGFSNPLDYIRIQDGEPVIDLSNLTREQAAAISEVTTEIVGCQKVVDEEGNLNEVPIRRVKLKFHSKVESLDKLGKYLKLFTDRVEHDFGDLSRYTPEELQTLRDLAAKTSKP